MMIRLFLTLLFTFACAAPAFAQSQDTDVRPLASRVTGDALLSAFSGITHNGAYNFSQQGRASNFYTETHTPEGRVKYTEDDEPFTGDWAIYRDSLCFMYDEPKMTGGCFRVYQVGTCYYYYSTTIMERRDELDRDYWTARSVKAGDEATCEATFS